MVCHVEPAALARCYARKGTWFGGAAVPAYFVSSGLGSNDSMCDHERCTTGNLGLCSMMTFSDAGSNLGGAMEDAEGGGKKLLDLQHHFDRRDVGRWRRN